MHKPGIGVLLLAVSISGCSWVKLTAEGEKVRVLSADEVATCTKKGDTTVSLRDKVAGVKRGAEKVKTELEALARNSAPDLGGDTVVATSEIADGKQTFTVYRCVGAQ